MSHALYTGVVLQRRQHREADEILTVWSWERGKVRLLARGVRASTSKLKTSLAPAYWLQLHAVPDSRIPIITYVRTVERYPGIVGDLLRTVTALQMFEMVGRTSADAQPNHALSLLLRMSLGALSAGTDPMAVLIRFRFGLLDAIGFGLPLDRCGSCSALLSANEPRRWDPVQFGISGVMCCPHIQGESVAPSLLDFLVACVRQPLFQVPKAHRSVVLAVDQWLAGVVVNVIQRPLSTREFWREHIGTESASL